MPGAAASKITHKDILAFWFEAIAPAQWWKVDPAFDALLAERFGELLERAAQGELFGWRAEPEGRLAEILVLDQFSRNIHRGTPRAFARDPMALALAQEAVAAGVLPDIRPAGRAFLLMPYMHSESALIHVQAEFLFRAHAPGNLEFELKHKAIVDRFGRYPHRNAILGRESSDAEREFLTQPGSSF
jgi:uncharacterized protein (DUF924 family)